MMEMQVQNQHELKMEMYYGSRLNPNGMNYLTQVKIELISIFECSNYVCN